MLRDLELLIGGTDAEHNVKVVIPVHGDEAMTCALRAIASDAPDHCIEYSGSISRRNCGQDVIRAMVPALPPLPAGAQTTLLPAGHEVIAADAKRVLEDEAKLGRDLVHRIRSVASGTAVEGLNSILARLKAADAAAAAKFPPAPVASPGGVPPAGVTEAKPAAANESSKG